MTGSHSTERSFAETSMSHHRSSSSEFGDFHTAPLGASYSPTSTKSFDSRRQTNYDDTDLLMSFDDIDDSSRRTTNSTTPSQQGIDLLTDSPETPTITLSPHPTPSPRPQPRHALSRSRSIDLLGTSPTRSRHLFPSSFAGPSSPPRLTTDAGSDIIFHAPLMSGKDDAASEFRRIRRLSESGNSMSNRTPAPRHASADARSPPRSRSIIDAFGTAKLATKWKRSVHHSSAGGDEPPTKTAMPIDIAHTSPFASIDQIAGTYIAPSGAPGYRSSDMAAPRAELDDEWSNTRLVGRREMTSPVLRTAEAQALRPLLPPRHRITNSWTLLFSLDQHGASLSTLYREVEKYARNHRTAGNLLVALDGNGHKFGIFLNEPILKREGTYYGSGESFMYKFVAGQSQPRAFRWTGRNQYIALCETSFISFGGGGTSYGLLLDSTFSRNSSATSPAFQNEVLCSGPDVVSEKSVAFDCVGLEVWATA